MKTTFKAMLAVMAWAAAGSAMANTYTVTKTADTFDGSCDSDCSLREAVQAANLRPGADLIRLPAGRYALSLGTVGVSDEQDNSVNDLDVSGALDIVGAARDTTIIDGNYRDRVLEILSGATFRAASLTITKGQSFDISKGGAGIFNAGVAMLRNARITANGKFFSSPAGSAGAGIENLGTLTLENCLIDGNTASGHGGGLLNSGTLYLRRSEVSWNTASGSVGGGLSNDGSAYVEQSLFSGNTASQSFGTGGFAIFNSGSMEVSNTTVSGNLNQIAEDFAFDLVGAVHNAGTMKLSFATITDNIGGGLYNQGTISLSGTVIAGNLTARLMREPPEEDDVPFDDPFIEPSYDGFFANCGNDGDYTSVNTVVSLNGSCTGEQYIVNASIGTLIEPLRLSGGVTATHKPRRGSLLVDAIDPLSAADACSAVDQRGARRPPNDDGRRGLRCDIGAYELLQ